VIALVLLFGLLQAAPADIKVEKVASRLAFAEGPVWSREGYLLYSDAPNNRILKLAPGERAVTYREDTHGANGLTLDALGRLYLCEWQSRRLTRLDKKGNLEVLAEKWEGKKLNAPNDVAVRHDGNIYFTDPAFGSQNDTRELDFYGVFHIGPKGEMEVIAKPKGRPNGITISPNGKALYVVNSDEKNVRAYDLDKAGAASNERILIPAIEGVPDGIRADEKGNLYIAAKDLFVFSPQGKLLYGIKLGETPANCAFGDADLQTLYITAQSSVYRVRLDVKGAVQY